MKQKTLKSNTNQNQIALLHPGELPDSTLSTQSLLVWLLNGVRSLVLIDDVFNPVWIFFKGRVGFVPIVGRYVFKTRSNMYQFGLIGRFHHGLPVAFECEGQGFLLSDDAKNHFFHNSCLYVMRKGQFALLGNRQ